MNANHKSVAIKCNFIRGCRTYFLSKKDLHHHIQDVHNPGVAFNKLKCPCCDKLFIDFEMVKEHAERVHTESILSCIAKRCRFLVR
jgi:hypothetical protein